MKRNTAFYVLGVLVLLGCLCLSWQGDRIEYRITGENFIPIEEGYVLADRYQMPAGTYHITAKYLCTQPEMTAELMLTTAFTRGVGDEVSPEYARFTLDPESGYFDGSFTLPQAVPDLRLYILTQGVDFELTAIQISAEERYFQDTVLLLAAIAMGGVLWYFYRKGARYRAPLYVDQGSLDPRKAVLACLLLGLCASWPYMSGMIGTAHDYFFHVGRIDGIRDGLLAGQFPVRINTASSYGTGYANNIMYPELFLYPFALLRLCGVSMLVTYKLLCLSINITTAFVAYYAFRRLYRSDHMGLAASALYTMGLYRLTNIYTRAAIGETLAMVFLPLVVLGMYEVCCGSEKRWPVLMLGMWGVCGSHALSLVCCALFCGLFALANLRAVLCKKRLLAIGKAAGLCVLLCAWWLIPFADFSTLDLHIFHVEGELARHAVYPAQMFTMFGGAGGGSLPLGRTQGEMPLSVGLLLGFGLIAYLLSQWQVWRGKLVQTEHVRQIGRHCLLFSLVALWMASTLFPWEIVQRIPLLGRVLGTIQFPWRYLGFATAFLCVVGILGLYAFLLTDKQKRVGVAVVLCASVLAAAPYLDNAQYTLETTIPSRQSVKDLSAVDSFYYFESSVTNTERESSAARVPFVRFSQKDAKITDFVKNGTSLTIAFTTNSPEAGAYLDTRLYAYPGYTAWLDGERLETVRNENDELRVLLPEGTTGGTVKLRYTGKWFYRVGDALSLLTLLACIAWLILRKGRKSVETAVKLPKTV